MMENAQSQKVLKRFAVVLSPNIEGGAAVNAAAIVTGGLQSEGFAAPITDQSGVPHSAIIWNLVVLQARSQAQIENLLHSLRDGNVSFVVFTASGRALSNSFEHYQKSISESKIDSFDVLAVGLFGNDVDVRGLTKKFSVFK